MALVLLLYYVYSHPDDEKTHEKYLEYRMLAESLRVQYFISKAGIKKRVVDILPWFTEIRIPLIKDVLSDLSTIETGKKEHILDSWIRNQMNYHAGAHKKALKQEEKNELYEKISLILTIAFYVTHWVRAGLKIGVGTATAITIFLSNYYGKMSLSSKVEEHMRMYLLYQKIEFEIKKTREEREEQIIYLAKQCLIENTVWYSHQKKNEPDFAVE